MDTTRGNFDHNASPIFDGNPALGVDMADPVGNEGLIAYAVRRGGSTSARGTGRNFAEVMAKLHVRGSMTR